MDLLWREWLRLSAPQDEHADDVLAARQRDTDDRSDVEETSTSVVFRICEHIDDRRRPFVYQHTARDAAAVRLDRLIGPVSLQAFAVEIAGVRDQPPAVALETGDGSVVGGAQPDRVHRHALEHAVEIECRAAHVLEDIGDPGLPLEGLLSTFEQASVLDGDDRLVREGAHERDLPIRERAHLVPSEDEDPCDDVTTEQRYAKHRPITGEPLEVLRRVLRVGQDVGDVDHRAVQSGPADEGVAAGHTRGVVGDPLELRVRGSPERRGPVNVAVE